MGRRLHWIVTDSPHVIWVPTGDHRICARRPWNVASFTGLDWFSSVLPPPQYFFSAHDSVVFGRVSTSEWLQQGFCLGCPSHSLSAMKLLRSYIVNFQNSFPLRSVHELLLSYPIVISFDQACSHPQWLSGR